ncbi:uncharacterized protein CCR75_005988 [Bremia lactucae]|uniref:Uncharacterized protein n=1 Tax=Bremia lactucae TaxID=4779 RepID=A0A976FR49_BRELC|nr:hypothetical protein CCR75_005988 [Bremia lactucae]
MVVRLALQLISWLALQSLRLALYLAPAAAALTAVVGIVLVSSMMAQALEYGVLTAVYRSKWHKNSQYDDLRSYFYRAYWLATLLYALSSSFWIHYTERADFRQAFGFIFFALWWALQLVLVLALTPFGKILPRMKAAIK